MIASVLSWSRISFFACFLAVCGSESSAWKQGSAAGEQGQTEEQRQDALGQCPIIAVSKGVPTAQRIGDAVVEVLGRKEMCFALVSVPENRVMEGFRTGRYMATILPAIRQTANDPGADVAQKELPAIRISPRLATPAMAMVARKETSLNFEDVRGKRFGVILGLDEESLAPLQPSTVMHATDEEDLLQLLDSGRVDIVFVFTTTLALQQDYSDYASQAVGESHVYFYLHKNFESHAADISAAIQDHLASGGSFMMRR